MIGAPKVYNGSRYPDYDRAPFRSWFMFRGLGLPTVILPTKFEVHMKVTQNVTNLVVWVT